MISTHILDLSKGIPARGVAVTLLRQNGKTWEEVSRGDTNEDGRFAFASEASAGVYQITFDTQSYLAKDHSEVFFQGAQVTFKIENTARKYHIPLLLSPFGYSTYRGS